MKITKPNKENNKIKNSEIKNKKEINVDKIPKNTNYFRLLKEMEKESEIEKLYQLEQEDNNNNKDKENKNLTEKIYNQNLKNLRNYYNKNKKDLKLYGSQKYDSLPIKKCVKEMTNYEKRVIDRLKSNQDDTKINSIVENYANCRDKVILTPLAENEKDRNEMENMEKEKFDKAERLGVVVRMIEYTSSLRKKADFKKNEENKEIISKFKKAVNLISDYWLNYKYRKKIREEMKRGKDEFQSKIERFSFTLRAKKTKKLINLMKNYEKFKQLYEETKKEKDKKEKETKKLNNICNSIKLNFEKKNVENDELNEKFNKIKEQNEILTNQKTKGEEIISQLESEKNNLMNDNNILKQNYSNLDEEYNNFKKEKKLADIENENKLKSFKKNFDEEKNDMNKNINELQNNLVEKIKKIEEQKNK